MTISPHQIRAARAMKNWNQSELAKNAGVALPTIANIEIGKQKPGVRTLDKIKTTLEEAGIEFIDNDGIRKKKDSITILRGQKEYIGYFDMLYEHAKNVGGSIYLANSEEQFYELWYPGFFKSEYFQKMKDLRDQIDFRITVKEGNTYFPATDYVEYRWIPKEQFSPIPFQVFGEYLAIKLLFFDEPIIFLIKNKQTADLYREKFLAQWETAIIPPQFKSKA